MTNPFSVLWRSAVNVYDELFPMVGMNLLWLLLSIPLVLVVWALFTLLHVPSDLAILLALVLALLGPSPASLGIHNFANQLVKEEISTLLQRELKDPRLGFVSVTEVDTSQDLRAAKVFVSVLGDEAQWTASLAALVSARGFIRNWLRQHLDLRVTPELDFRPDRSMEHAARIQALLRQVGGEAGR